MKIGIHLDIEERAPELVMPRGILCDALRIYVGRWAYRIGHTQGAVRVDLNGAPAGEVTAAQAAAVRARSDRAGRP